MTDTEATARMFRVAAEALNRSSMEPNGGQTPNDYLRNDLFRTIARALDDEAERINPPAEPVPHAVTCSWCTKLIASGIATVRHPVSTSLGNVVEVYHADCWDRKQRAERPTPGPVYLHYRPLGSKITLCGVSNPTHASNGTRYVDCPACLAHPEFPARTI